MTGVKPVRLLVSVGRDLMFDRLVVVDRRPLEGSNHPDFRENKTLITANNHPLMRKLFRVLALPLVAALESPKPVRTLKPMKGQQPAWIGRHEVTSLQAVTNTASNNSEDFHKQPPVKTLTSSPCVRICRYNADLYDGVVCIGCFREAFEIASWNSFSASERLYALQDAIDRQQSAAHYAETISDRFTGAIAPEMLLEMINEYRKLL
jgi:predicted Fe-S protein YdhL (DUF1289 family)